MTEAPVTAVTAAGEQREVLGFGRRGKNGQKLCIWKVLLLQVPKQLAAALSTYNHPQGKALHNRPQPGDTAAHFAAPRYLHVRHFSVVGRALEGQAAEAALDVIARLCS